MFRKALAFVTRRDGIFKRRATRRLNSPRASAFLEYAIILPLFILVISTMVEFAAFWDAKIMANHTAWTCARIAAVEAGQKTDYVEKPSSNRLKTKGMTTATTLLMSTCAMGSMHGDVKEWGQHWYEELVKKPLEQLKKSIKDNLKSSLTKILSETIGKFLGDNVVAKFVEKIVEWISGQLLNPIIDFIEEQLDKFFDWMFQWLGKLLEEERILRQLAYAAFRLKEFPDTITVTERTTVPFVFSKSASSTVGDTRLDFPRVLDSSADCDKWFVKSDSAWPPNKQSQRMIDVTIRWPFERAWMFPVLSTQKLSAGDSKSLEGVPTAVGRAMAYPQPIISNDNLKSEGATPYDPGNTNSIPSVVQEIIAKYKGFLKVAALYYHYQMKNEEVGPYDSKKGGSGTYKGIGLGVSGGPDKKKYHTHDGLVFWMERAPDKPEDQGAWKSHPRPADYYQCWKNITEEDGETCYFWYAVEFLSGKRPALKHLCNHDYWNKEWFHWTCSLTNAGKNHLRDTHKKPKAQYVLNFTGIPGIVINAPCFILPSDVRNPYSYNVTEKDFKARIPAAEKDTVTWKLYKDAKSHEKSNLLKSNIPTMVDAMCSSPNRETIQKDEPDAFNRIRYACDQTNEDAWDMIKNCSKELDDALDGGKGGDAGDPGEFMDFGLTDEEIMRDPTNAAKIIEKKLNELKPKVIEAVVRIDKAEQALRDLDAKFEKKLVDWRNRRHTALTDFAVNITRAALLAGSTDSTAIRNKLKSDLRSPCSQVLTVTKEFNQFTLDWKAALVEYYNAEVALGQLLNCKYAKGKTPKRPDDPDPGLPKPDPDPDRPGPSSAQSGSDEDNLGDSWTHQEGGWYKDGKKEDL